MNTPNFSIAAVERDTGLSKDVLRMWERRYGFPQPERDANGERTYPAEQVERLRLIKRLMDQGHRPGKLMQSSPDGLAQLLPRRLPEQQADTEAAPLAPLLERITASDTAGFQQLMQQRLAREGLQRFVLDTVAPLTEAVGTAWEEGRVAVFEEHLYTEQTKRLLRQALAGLPAGGNGPRILLTTPPEEQHALGLLMAEVLLTLEGATCIPLGTQTPLMEIRRACEVHKADIVALSISAAYPARKVAPLILQLRQLLPENIAVWAGGAGMLRQPLREGIVNLTSLKDALEALEAWRKAHA
jgi:DNA-binding transcriptional MerR regulator/methylmalonyl-CoA mutase cobalamin-binding subunit